MRGHVLQLSAPRQSGECLLVAVLDDGAFRVARGRGWPAAIEAMQGQCGACELTWASNLEHGPARDASMEELITRATVALGLVLGVEAEHHPVLHRLIHAWKSFVEAELWDQLKPEVGLRVTKRGESELISCVAVLGHGSGEERGLAFYEDVSSFDALWSGEPSRVDGLSVLADPENQFLRLSFEALGVPPPVVIAITDSQPRAPSLDELALADACVRVLLGAPQEHLELRT